MDLVVIESPYAGKVKENMEYLERCLYDSLQRCESPYASHKMLTTCLDDDYPDERSLGIEAGLAWLKSADKQVFYADRGWSKGMLAAKKAGEEIGICQEVRYIDRV